MVYVTNRYNNYSWHICRYTSFYLITSSFEVKQLFIIYFFLFMYSKINLIIIAMMKMVIVEISYFDTCDNNNFYVNLFLINAIMINIVIVIRNAILMVHNSSTSPSISPFIFMPAKAIIASLYNVCNILVMPLLWWFLFNCL